MAYGGTLMDMRHFDTELHADPSRVVLRPFSISSEPRASAHGIMTRAERIAKAVIQLTDEECRKYLDAVDGDFFGFPRTGWSWRTAQRNASSKRC